MNMKEALAAAIKAAAVKAIAAGTIKEGDLPEVLLEVPPQKEFGDFATNFASNWSFLCIRLTYTNRL